MEPITKTIDLKITLLSPIIINNQEITEIQVNLLILRPILKRIVFLTEELNRVIIYEGDKLFEAHKDDSQEILITKLLEVIEATYK